MKKKWPNSQEKIDNETSKNRKIVRVHGLISLDLRVNLSKWVSHPFREVAPAIFLHLLRSLDHMCVQSTISRTAQIWISVWTLSIPTSKYKSSWRHRLRNLFQLSKNQFSKLKLRLLHQLLLLLSPEATETFRQNTSLTCPLTIITALQLFGKSSGRQRGPKLFLILDTRKKNSSYHMFSKFTLSFKWKCALDVKGKTGERRGPLETRI